MRIRHLVHVNKIEEFKEFCQGLGYRIEQPKGVYEVLRIKKNGPPVLFYKKDRTDHLTCFGKDGLRLAYDFINGKRITKRKKRLPHGC